MLVEVMVWRLTSDKPLPESMLDQFTDAYMWHLGRWVKTQLYVLTCYYNQSDSFHVFLYIILSHENYSLTILLIHEIICIWQDKNRRMMISHTNKSFTALKFSSYGPHLKLLKWQLPLQPVIKKIVKMTAFHFHCLHWNRGPPISRTIVWQRGSMACVTNH